MLQSPVREVGDSVNSVRTIGERHREVRLRDRRTHHYPSFTVVSVCQIVQTTVVVAAVNLMIVLS